MKKEIKTPWYSYYDGVRKHLKYPDNSLYELIEESAQNHLDVVSYNYFGTKRTYREFLNEIDECARAFKAIGVKQNDTVSICMPNTPEAIISFYAINTVLSFTNRMLYQMVVQYIINYCKNNEIPYEVNDGCLVVNERVLSEGNELFYNVFELDEILQTIKENNLNCSLKSSLAKAYRDKMDQRFFGNRDCDEIFDAVLNCEIFDYDFVTSFYNDKSSEVCNLVNMGKLPDSLLSVSYIKDASKNMYKDIRNIIFSIMVEYCNRYNIKLNNVDGVITLDDEVIGTDNGYFYDLFELDKKLSLLRKDDKKLI